MFAERLFNKRVVYRNYEVGFIELNDIQLNYYK